MAPKWLPNGSWTHAGSLIWFAALHPLEHQRACSATLSLHNPKIPAARPPCQHAAIAASHSIGLFIQIMIQTNPPNAPPAWQYPIWQCQTTGRKGTIHRNGARRQGERVRFIGVVLEALTGCIRKTGLFLIKGRFVTSRMSDRAMGTADTSQHTCGPGVCGPIAGTGQARA